MSNTWEETSVEIDHSQEPLEGFGICWRWEGKDWLDMGGKWSEAIGCDVVAKEINLLLREDTLGRIDVEAIFCKNGEDCVKMGKML